MRECVCPPNDHSRITPSASIGSHTSCWRQRLSVAYVRVCQLLARLTLKHGVNLDLDDFITPTRKFELEIVRELDG